MNDVQIHHTPQSIANFDLIGQSGDIIHAEVGLENFENSKHCESNSVSSEIIRKLANKHFFTLYCRRRSYYHENENTTVFEQDVYAN